jgi:predicted O-methyltransferase YrrM
MKPEIFLELGTCGGGASRHVATKNPDVKVISIDVTKLPQVSEIACPNFQFILGDSIETAKTLGPQYQGKIGIIFIDTIHEYQHTMNEFNAWKSYMAPGGIMFFDDLYRQGMDRVWKELPETKTEFHALSKMHIGGSPTDGGFGAIIL